jgi:hypothetical protein
LDLKKSLRSNAAFLFFIIFFFFLLAMKVAPRKCYNIQSFSGVKHAEIVLTTNKLKPLKPVPIKRSAGAFSEESDFREKCNPAKRLRADSKTSKDSTVSVPSCSAFVELVQSYIRSLVVQDDRKIEEVRRQISLLQEQYTAKRHGNSGTPLSAFQAAKLESSYSIQRQRLLKKIQDIGRSPVVQHGREIGIRYICRYQDKETGDDEKLAIILDFQGRFCVSGDPPIQQCNTMMCQRCNIPMFIRNEDGFLMCKTCCTTEAYSERVPYIGLNTIDDADSTAQSSKKVSNFRDYLHLLQGKKANVKLESDLPAMLDYISLRPSEDVTVDSITKMLVHLGKRKYIKYMALLESRLRKASQEPRVPQMSLQLENKFCSNFLMLVDPYERHKPPSRKHFMSYAYCGWQFCRIENTPEFFVLFRLLKDPAKIEKQDETFAKICPEIGWTFESSTAYKK